ncbi:MAG: hypothetical protein V5A64_06615 [Candidatus Thermoplasmatota archaeon]
MVSIFNRITDFLREYTLPLSSVVTIASIILLMMGAIWFGLREALTSGEIPLGAYTNLIEDLGNWNFYLLVVGFILLITGVWYLYNYHKNKKFLLEEIKTNKRSELIKNRHELDVVSRHLPSKYRKMYKDKLKKLNIK